MYCVALLLRLPYLPFKDTRHGSKGFTWIVYFNPYLDLHGAHGTMETEKYIQLACPRTPSSKTHQFPPPSCPGLPRGFSALSFVDSFAFRYGLLLLAGFLTSCLQFDRIGGGLPAARNSHRDSNDSLRPWSAACLCWRVSLLLINLRDPINNLA